MTHPLTDEWCEKVYPWSDAKHTRRAMRVTADWQLARVIEWLKDGGYATDLLLDLKAAMRPQKES